jgi:cold shock CspA family protein
MRFEGELKSWNADRGFGFIESKQGGQEIFVHISAIPTAFRPPKMGQLFTFEVELNREGKKRAANLGLPVTRRPAAQARRGGSAPWSFASAFWGTVVLNVAGFVAYHSPLRAALGA